jgi:hypothetical protein
MSSLIEIAKRIQQRVPVPKVAAPHEAWCIGVDLAPDFAALCVLERLTITTEEFRHKGFEAPAIINTKKKIHRLRCLQRLPSGYPEIIDIVSTLIACLPEAQMPPALAVNVTLVGKPVAILMVKAGLPVTAITATAGDAEQRVARGEYRVPGKDLIGTLAVLLQGDRFRVAPDLPEAAALIAELGNFNASDDDSWESHNICRAVAIAAWWGERMSPPPKIEFSMAR